MADVVDSADLASLSSFLDLERRGAPMFSAMAGTGSKLLVSALYACGHPSNHRSSMTGFFLFVFAHLVEVETVGAVLGEAVDGLVDGVGVDEDALALDRRQRDAGRLAAPVDQVPVAAEGALGAQVRVARTVQLHHLSKLDVIDCRRLS